MTPFGSIIQYCIVEQSWERVLLENYVHRTLNLRKYAVLVVTHDSCHILRLC